MSTQLTIAPLRQALRAHALSLPEAWEDFPWGDCAMKVRKKIFVFLGNANDTLSISLKLPMSSERILEREDAKPTGYGLGKHGWVSLTLQGDQTHSLPEMLELVDESYRAVAPKTLARQVPI